MNESSRDPRTPHGVDERPSRVWGGGDALHAHVEEMLGGGFRLLQLLAQDGIEVIFEAVASADRGRVAVRTIAVDATLAPEARERLHREIQYARELQHPGIAPIRAEESGAVGYYTVELGRGETLESVLRSGRKLSFEETVIILSSVAEALDHAHEHGIVHGDLQPARIIVGGGGRALVSGFGYAVEQPPVGAVLPPEGAVAYRAPEQWRLEGGIDGRADQYALAIIAYEMLTGTRRLDASTTRGIQTINPVEVSADQPLAADVPLAANAALRRALAKNPTQRFATVREFTTALAERTQTPRGLPTVEPAFAALPSRSMFLPVVAALLVLAVALSFGAPEGREWWVGRWQGFGEWIGQAAGGRSAPSIPFPSAADPGVTGGGSGSSGGASGAGAGPAAGGVPAGGTPAGSPRPQPGGGLTIPATATATPSAVVGGSSTPSQPTRAAELGFVRVTVDRGVATVLVDGVPRGVAPWVGSFGPGTHSVSVRSVGGSYTPTEVSVTVVAGDTVGAQFTRR